MQLLLKQVKIIDPTSSYHNQVKDVLISEGRIEAIRNSISKEVLTIKTDDVCISPGWMDVGSYVGDPGHEQVESLESISAAAARGGYTSLAVLPNTNPSLHSKSEINYIRNNSTSLSTHIHAIGALTRDCAGKDMAEIIDMHHAGAIAFSDGKRPVQDAGVMLRSLQYAKAFDGLIINHPHLTGVSPEGLIDEGPMSVSLGLRGLPAIMEVLMLKRDIDLLRYSESRLHVLNISTIESIQLIADAKAEGLRITCSVPGLNLEASVERLSDFDSNYKVLPPLRSEDTRLALVEGVRNGTIDFITANHSPVDVEAKKLEFAYADFGISSLETNYSTVLKALGRNRSQTQVVEALAIKNRRILGLEIPTIERGNPAEITIFQPTQNTLYEKKTFASKSKNNPFLDQELPGKVIAITSKGMVQMVDSE